jgi:hypothetical protein
MRTKVINATRSRSSGIKIRHETVSAAEKCQTFCETDDFCVERRLTTLVDYSARPAVALYY